MLVVGYFTAPERAFADEAARLMLLVGFGTSLLAAAAAWLVAGRILRPLRDVAATARRITGTDLSRRVPQRRPVPADEIAELARTLNAMLDRVQSGVLAQRRFVDDAGHELRTPITIVRGHLGVLDAHDPDDVRDTVELTRDLFGKLTALAERDWRLESVAHVHARMDRQRITQAVVALADNAARFTGPGDRIALGSQLDGAELRIWVADDGPGVDPFERARVFRRFARGDTGPRSEGAGLGLSIVQAIATTHGGPGTAGEHPRSRGDVHAGAARRSAASRILVAEDEPRIAAFLQEGLSPRARRLRASGSTLPVIILTARDSVHDTVAGLEGGADDCMRKPFRFEELLARVRLRLDRARPPDRDVLAFHGLELDPRTRHVAVHGRRVDLSAREYALAEAFLRHPGQVLSRDQLLRLVWGETEAGSIVVDVYVRYLRRKLGADRIATVRGTGYRLEPRG